MPINPFIALGQDPVGALTWAGFAIVFFAIGFAAIRTVLRGIPTLYVRWEKNRHGDDWWAFGERRAGYIPPLGWTIQAIAYLLVLAIALWAGAALLWHLGV